LSPKLYKAADVCEATGVQAYVLRSWEKEFPGIGVQRSSESQRLYRESDLEQVRRIKHLVFAEGLTLAGARRRLEEDSPGVSRTREKEIAEVLDTLGADVRARIKVVREGLRSILETLAGRPGANAVAALRPVKSAPKRRTVRRKTTRAATTARKRPVARAKSRTTKGKRGRLRT
jgi:DNA-binding transcriptional MerR regulator